MWTQTFWVFVITAIVIGIAFALHKWVGVRRDVLGPDLAAKADSVWLKLWTWIKKRWDFAIAAIIAAAPVIWSAGLDLIVIMANMLAQVFPAVAGVDLSALMLEPATKAYIQLGALTIPPLRDALEKMRTK